jgi:3-isopropylmalate dehydrogenase
MFGDIITDLGAQLQGGLGLAASANVHPGGSAMFEPVHGSAPKYTGKDVANPLGAILTASMMLEHLGREDAAAAIDKAVMMSVAEYKCTRDLGGELGTAAVGDWLAEVISKGV